MASLVAEQKCLPYWSQLAKSKRSSEGNLSQNSPQPVADLDRTARSIKSITKMKSDGFKKRYKLLIMIADSYVMELFRLRGATDVPDNFPI